MSVRQTLPVREVLRGRRISWVDVVVGAGIIAVLYEVVHLGQSLAVNFTPGRTPVVISTDTSNVPYYAAQSLLGIHPRLDPGCSQSPFVNSATIQGRLS